LDISKFIPIFAVENLTTIKTDCVYEKDQVFTGYIAGHRVCAEGMG
jgi:hypothetical protein